jgi:glycosyltransferase involved in cell wall biosynthesis
VARVCLITPSHISFQPRTVREADTLHEAGHSVRVIACQVDEGLVAADARLVESRRWRYQAIDLRRSTLAHWPWLRESVRTKVSRFLFLAGLVVSPIARYAYVKGTAEMRRLAASEPADWIVAHNHGALAVAADAAAALGARLGFDCEDDLADSDVVPPEIIRWIERRYLGRCHYVSAPSRAIANRLVERHGVRPIVLYNTQAPALASGLLPPERRARVAGLRLHWFSQTIGPGRGVEGVIRSLADLPSSVELHLRGSIRPAYRAELESLAARAGARERVRFLPVVDASTLVAAMGSFDVGLAVEEPRRTHYALTVTNKIFTYLLAGLAIAATDLPGHREIWGEIAEAGFLFSAADTAALAAGIRRWTEQPETLLRAQRASWRAGRETFSWDRDRQRLLDVIASPREVAAR